MSLDEQFKTVSDTVKNWSKKPSNDENLALYSLFKQANFGDVNIPQPSGMVESAKWKAWSGRKGMSADEAKKQYIDLANQWQAKYA
ncbi:putative acyl-CoA-binding protein isoform X2 [Plutella xylostella]|nr:putative acyl-CoA-binding protein isoform X2 [Plutella xylostella]